MINWPLGKFGICEVDVVDDVELASSAKNDSRCTDDDEALAPFTDELALFDLPPGAPYGIDDDKLSAPPKPPPPALKDE